MKHWYPISPLLFKQSDEPAFCQALAPRWGRMGCRRGSPVPGHAPREKPHSGSARAPGPGGTDRMDVAGPLVRAAVRAGNAAGRALRSLGVAPGPFEAQALIERARRATGLDDLGADEIREPLDVLLRSLHAEGRLTLVGRIAARQDLQSLLAERLRLRADRQRHPQIAAERIVRPLFIVGLPRTGSTLLHHLLAQDEASRVAQAWEIMAPSPPPEQERYASDPRIRRAARRLRFMDRLAPEFKTIHPLGSQLPLECIAIMSYALLSPRFHTTYHTPSYQRWLARQDLRPAYELHRRVLQHLQWRAPAGRWVLKAPSHLWAFDTLFGVYPDALVVQTHRDPVTVLASVASLTAVLQGAFAEDLDMAEIGDEVTERWTTGLERALAARRLLPEERFVDVHYRDLVRDPLGVVQRIYRAFGLPLTGRTRERMARFLADSARDRRAPHVYSLRTFGLDAGDLAHRFEAYREHFDIPAERPGGDA